MRAKRQQIKGLVFDKDGTLFDFSATWAVWAKSFLYQLSDHDHVRAMHMGAMIGFDYVQATFDPASVAIGGTHEDVAQILAPAVPGMTKGQLARVMDAEAAKAPQSEAVPLHPLLSGLRNRALRLGVATNDAHASAMAHLRSVGISEQFEFIAGYDSGFGGKPAAGQLLAFAQRMQLAPQQCAMIGDSTHDLRAGRAAGMTCIGVLSGPADVDTLMPFADVVLPDIGHLPAWLDGLTGGIERY